MSFIPLQAHATLPVEDAPSKGVQKPQKGGNYGEFIKQKREYLMKYVGLSSEDSVAFFPLYDELQRQRFDLQRQARRAANELASRETTPSDKECLVLARRLNGVRLQEGELGVEYFKKFEKILTPQQLLKLELSEMRFSHYMLNQTRGKHPERKNTRKK